MAPRVDKSPARVRAMFDQITREYDRLNRVLSGRLDLRWRRIAAREARGRVLDLCAGTGDMAAAVGVGRCVAADFSRGMLQRGRVKFPQLTCAAADALRLPFRDGAFDAVTVAFGVRNFADLDRGLAEMRRVAARAIILELTPPPGAIAPLLTRGVPFVGRLLSHGRIDAYRYLADSIAEFLDGAELARRLERAGYSRARHRRLALGLATIVTAL